MFYQIGSSRANWTEHPIKQSTRHGCNEEPRIIKRIFPTVRHVVVMLVTHMSSMQGSAWHKQKLDQAPTSTFIAIINMIITITSFSPLTLTYKSVRGTIQVRKVVVGLNHFWCNFKKIHSLRRYEINHRQVFIDHSRPGPPTPNQDSSREDLEIFLVDKWFPVIFPTVGSVSRNFIIKLMEVSGVSAALMILIITPSPVIRTNQQKFRERIEDWQV